MYSLAASSNHNVPQIKKAGHTDPPKNMDDFTFRGTATEWLMPGDLASLRRDYLRLLPPGPDLVRRLLPRKTQQSTPPGCPHPE